MIWSRVIVETPFSGDRRANLDYLRRCMRDCLERGEAPYASHLLYTQMLEDDDPEHREMGIEAGLTWGEQAQLTVVYTDRGISGGMKLGIARAEEQGRAIEYRTLPERLKAIDLPAFPVGP